MLKAVDTAMLNYFVYSSRFIFSFTHKLALMSRAKRYIFIDILLDSSPALPTLLFATNEGAAIAHPTNIFAEINQELGNENKSGTNP